MGRNARVYWEMFDGVIPESQPALYVRYVDIDVDVGGYKAKDYPSTFRLAVYGRRRLEGANIETIATEDISLVEGGPWPWRRVRIRAAVESTHVRCVVVKMEEVTDSTYAAGSVTHYYYDQYDDEAGGADPPAWGFRIKKVHVYGSPLGRNVRPDLVFTDILDNPGFTYDGPIGTWTAEQLAYVSIPYDRQEAIDDFNGMLGWNYACWDGAEVKFALPATGTAWEIDAGDPRTTWAVTESLDETYNAVRVCYGNKRGKQREVIEHGDESAIGFMRADTLQAPDSIKTEKAARRLAKRYLRAHEKRQVAGTLTITGYDGVTGPDPLLIRPGDTITMVGPAKFLSGTHEVTHVTLNPLEWSATVQFGTNSKRFDQWLARLAAGAKAIKRR